MTQRSHKSVTNDDHCVKMEVSFQDRIKDRNFLYQQSQRYLGLVQTYSDGLISANKASLSTTVSLQQKEAESKI